MRERERERERNEVMQAGLEKKKLEAHHYHDL
jgi:hypothetical protein